MMGFPRARSWLKLAATDEKDLSTSQSPKKTDAWVPGPNGHARWAQRDQTPAGKRPPSSGCSDPTEAARVEESVKPGGFKASDRLRRSAEFKRLQRSGLRIQSPHFVLYVSKAPENERSRLGIAVSRRIGRAVVRNRLKRRMRECFRLKLRNKLPAGTALVIIARTGAATLSWDALQTELETAAGTIGRRLQSVQEAR